MAYVAPTTRADGYVVDAAEWNKNTVDNPIALKALIDALPTATARNSLPCGRLTLTSATPVTTADVTAATTLYYALYSGNQIWLYTGSAWTLMTIAELSIAVPATTGTGYDVFVDYNGGTPQLSLTAWSSLTVRATALTRQDGVLVLTGSTGKRYVGSFRTTGVSGQTEDSNAKRYVWNHYHRTPRPLVKTESTASWTYTTATVRQANGAAANQVEVFVGVAEVPIDLTLVANGINDSGSPDLAIGIGEDSTTTFAVGVWWEGAAAVNIPASVRLEKYPAIGHHAYSWNEWSEAGTGTTTWYGLNTKGSTTANGLRGSILG